MLSGTVGALLESLEGLGRAEELSMLCITSITISHTQIPFTAPDVEVCWMHFASSAAYLACVGSREGPIDAVRAQILRLGLSLQVLFAKVRSKPYAATRC